MNKLEQTQHYKDGLGPINQEDYTYVDTKAIQIASLNAFAAALGYWSNPFTNSFHAEDYQGFKGCPTISFSTMVKLHDANWMRGTPEYNLVPEFNFVNKLAGGYYEKTFQLDAYTLNKAQACKIVERIFIHCTKNGVLKCYKSQVQFTDSAYQQMFLKPLIEKENV